MYLFNNLTYLPEQYLGLDYHYNFKNQVIELYYLNNDTNNYEMIEIYPYFDYHQSKPVAATLDDYNNAPYNESIFTTDIFYRVDLSHILFVFCVLSIFIVLIPYKIISRWFGRWLKV